MIRTHRPLIRTLVAAVVSATVGAGAVGCSASAPRTLLVRVNSGPVAFDAALDLTVTGADPAQPVRVTATATDAEGTRWEAHADYTPAAQGSVDVRTSPAGSGGYQGAHDTGCCGRWPPGRAIRSSPWGTTRP